MCLFSESSMVKRGAKEAGHFLTQVNIATLQAMLNEGTAN